MTSLAIGNRRLLKLANILDTADAAHRKRKEPTYSQYEFTHDCGTPACALGHWAAANPRRWYFEGSLYPQLRNAGSPYTSPLDDACDEFSIDSDETQELFDVGGCGNARTAKQAAKYIRAFVKRRADR